MPYLSAYAVVIRYEEALYQVYAPLPYIHLTFLYALPSSTWGQARDRQTYRQQQSMHYAPTLWGRGRHNDLCKSLSLRVGRRCAVVKSLNARHSDSATTIGRSRPNAITSVRFVFSQRTVAHANATGSVRHARPSVADRASWNLSLYPSFRPSFRQSITDARSTVLCQFA